MTNWVYFAETLNNQFKNGSFSSLELAAEFIADTYFKSVLGSSPETTVVAFSAKRQLFVQTIVSVMQGCLSANIPFNLALIGPALVSFYTGLAFTVPVAVVTVPGVFTVAPPPPPSPTPEPFVLMLTTFFSTHAASVVLDIGGTPTPLPSLPTS